MTLQVSLLNLPSSFGHAADKVRVEIRCEELHRTFTTDFPHDMLYEQVQPFVCNELSRICKEIITRSRLHNNTLQQGQQHHETD